MPTPQKRYGTPGPRAIYPEVADSPSLRRTHTLVAHLLFDRLIALADDQGRLQGTATELRTRCLANALELCSDDDVTKALRALGREGMVRLYRVGGEQYVQLEHWWEWQSNMRRAYPSRHPAPPGWDDRIYGRWQDDNTDPDPPAEPPKNGAANGATGAPEPAAGSQQPAAPTPRGGAPASAGSVLGGLGFRREGDRYVTPDEVH